MGKWMGNNTECGYKLIKKILRISKKNTKYATSDKRTWQNCGYRVLKYDGYNKIFDI